MKVSQIYMVGIGQDVVCSESTSYSSPGFMDHVNIQQIIAHITLLVLRASLKSLLLYSTNTSIVSLVFHIYRTLFGCPVMYHREAIYKM